MQLLSYAKHRNAVTTNGFDSSTESGYSVYVFGPDSGDYCIFNEVGPFQNLRILLWASFGALEVSITFAIPLIMFSLYREFKRKMNDDESRLRYYVWAVIVVIALLIGPMYACNGLAIHRHSHFKDLTVELICLAVFLGFLPILDFMAIIAMFASKRKFAAAAEDQTFLYNVILSFRNEGYSIIDQSEDESTLSRMVVKDIRHIALITVITWFAQLALFHSVFISFAVIAAPIESGSLLLLYLSSLFALISVLATGLKMVHKVESRIGFSFASITFIFLSIGVAGGIGVFVTFIYKYTLLIQEYRNSRGVIAFLGPIVPSVLATIVGGIFTTIISCIKVGHPSTNTDRSTGGTQEDVVLLP